MWQQLPHKFFKYCEKLFTFHFYERSVSENNTSFYWRNINTFEPYSPLHLILYLESIYVYIENTKNVWIDVLEIKKMIACLKRMRRNCFDYLEFVFDIRGGKRQTGNKL